MSSEPDTTLEMLHFVNCTVDQGRFRLANHFFQVSSHCPNTDLQAVSSSRYTPKGEGMI